MLRCSKEAFAKCPTRALCGVPEEASFAEGSECDLFNRRVADRQLTNGDRIRCASDEELVERLYNEWLDKLENGRDIATHWCNDEKCDSEECDPEKHKACILRWLRQPVKGEV